MHKPDRTKKNRKGKKRGQTEFSPMLYDAVLYYEKYIAVTTTTSMAHGSWLMALCYDVVMPASLCLLGMKEGEGRGREGGSLLQLQEHPYDEDDGAG